MTSRASLAAALLAAALLAASVSCDVAGDRAECAEDLVGLSTCVEYVEGTARTPTPDCCGGLMKVRAQKPKCLCVLIKDHDSPDLGLKLNVTLAVSLPAVCHVPANISACPKLLNLPPDSKEAQIFKPAEGAAGRGEGAGASDTTANPGPSAKTNSSASNDGARQAAVGTMMTWSFSYALSILPFVVIF
ncbi:putative GPI-anchored protein [Apostasia shenzhenica]|uniref:Putative GPI-anchored protein n=1 Tax=Apostasia shenzhenica TaxID=1088818 RepID=A0A2I0AAH2_9ASPA|nr:putative GPI-anchored protein [Apostasia shenzhenica]